MKSPNDKLIDDLRCELTRCRGALAYYAQLKIESCNYRGKWKKIWLKGYMQAKTNGILDF
ncbi:MAG: hypothetical protein ABR936_11825 [Bacteroidota bacterium]|jgi:hypothetical protein